MKLLQNILVTVEFNESLNCVIKNSIMLAEKFNSQITLMHVISDHNMSLELKKFVEESVRLKLDEITSDIKAKGIDLRDSIIENGIPFEKIIQEAQINDYNVIVAGAGNKIGKESFKLGTTVVKLMRKNQIPIWVVKQETVKDIKKILCPIDFSAASQRALNNAITLAKRFDAELYILHIYAPISYYTTRFDVDITQENKISKSKQEKEFHDLLEQVNLKDVLYKKIINEGVAHLEILEFIKENNIDLLLMGTTGRTGLSRLLMGSITEKVTRELPCSFITTKAKDITDDYFESNLKSIEAILNSAKQSFQNKDYEKAIDKYSIALKQYPDNIPIIMGIIESYQAIDNQHKVDYYRIYAREVIKRTWGEEYIDKLKL